jgi:preprotein translocase subunit SecB
MNVDAQTENVPKSQLILHRIYLKNSSFESFSVSMASIQNPIQPMVDMQVFANAYPQENNTHQAILGLKIEAKNQGNLIWRLQLETAGFYTLEGFNEEQQKDILHGYCMGQLYSHAMVIVTQMVVQGGFLALYLQPMDFNKMYQDKKKEALSKESEPSEVFAKRLNAVKDGAFTESVMN